MHLRPNRIAWTRPAWIVTLFLKSVCPVAAQPDPIVDGRFDDWAGVSAFYSDAQGDGIAGVDFGRIWMRNDDRYVYLSFEVSGEVALESESGIVLALDTDHDASTGQPFESIGAELIWRFGDRFGTFTSGSNSLDVASQDIGLVSAPTVSSPIFEISLDLDAEPRRLGVLFPADTVSLVLSHLTTGDRLPDEGAEALFVIDRNAAVRSYDVELDRNQPAAWRILAWNVLQDGLFESNRSSAFQRILRATGPDAIVFSEVFSHTAGQTLDRVNQLLPPDAGEQWYAASAPSSVVLVSKTPILEKVTVDSRGRAQGFLIGRPEGFDHDVLVIGAHLLCCEADVQRQLQVDEIMATIRDRRADGSLPALTPIIITGDMNFVGDPRQPATLIQGSIVNARFQPSYDPDWDDTAFADLVPTTTGRPAAFTWSDPRAAGDRQFSPGRLDYLIYSDAVLSVGNSFALYTLGIRFTDLQRFGLSATDSGVASDHLPIVADFIPAVQTASEASDLPSETGLELEVFPNPVSDRIQIRWSGQQAEPVTLEIYDVLGRRITSLRKGLDARASGAASIDFRPFPAGFYIVVLHTYRGAVLREFIKTNSTN